MLPMIGGEDDKSPVQLIRLLQLLQYAADLTVYEGDSGVVVGFDASEKIIVASLIPEFPPVLQSVYIGVKLLCILRHIGQRH